MEYPKQQNYLVFLNQKLSVTAMRFIFIFDYYLYQSYLCCRTIASCGNSFIPTSAAARLHRVAIALFQHNIQ